MDYMDFNRSFWLFSIILVFLVSILVGCTQNTPLQVSDTGTETEDPTQIITAGPTEDPSPTTTPEPTPTITPTLRAEVVVESEVFDWSGNLVSGCVPFESEQLSGLSTLIDTWRLYNAEDLQLSFYYPADWGIEGGLRKRNSNNPIEILSRVTFYGEEGHIDIDVWFGRGISFYSWLEWFSKRTNPIPYETESVISDENPYLIFMQNGGPNSMLSAFFTDGYYVYRIWSTVATEAGQQAFEKMLDSFILGEEGNTPEFSIPDQVCKDIEEHFISYLP